MSGNATSPVLLAPENFNLPIIGPKPHYLMEENARSLWWNLESIQSRAVSLSSNWPNVHCPLTCLFSLADQATVGPTCSWHRLILPWLVSFYPVLVTVRSIPGTVNRVAVNSMCRGFAKYTQLYLYNDTLHTILHHTVSPKANPEMNF